jgi:hypothetical protein
MNNITTNKITKYRFGDDIQSLTSSNYSFEVWKFPKLKIKETIISGKDFTSLDREGTYILMKDCKPSYVGSGRIIERLNVHKKNDKKDFDTVVVVVRKDKEGLSKDMSNRLESTWIQKFKENKYDIQNIQSVRVAELDSYDEDVTGSMISTIEMLICDATGIDDLFNKTEKKTEKEVINKIKDNDNGSQLISVFECVAQDKTALGKGTVMNNNKNILMFKNSTFKKKEWTPAFIAAFPYDVELRAKLIAQGKLVDNGNGAYVLTEDMEFPINTASRLIKATIAGGFNRQWSPCKA